MRCYADQQAGQQPAQQQRSAYPKHAAQDNQSRRLHDYQAQQPVSRRTQSQAYAHLMPALVDRVSKDSVDANRRQDHCQQRKADDEQHDEPALGDGVGDTLIHGLDVKDRLLTVNRRDGMAQGIREHRGIVRRAQCNVEVYIGELSHGDKEFRLHILFQSTVPYVVRDAYNRYPLEWIRTFLGIAPTGESLAQCVPSEVTLGEGQVDDGDPWRCLVVFSGERTPFENRSAALRGSNPASH